MSERKILKVYGSYHLTFRRWDGEWTVKRLNTQTTSRELADRIYDAIEAMPMADRTREATYALEKMLTHEGDSK